MADQAETDEQPSARKACRGLRQELIDCLLASDCVQKVKVSVSDCKLKSLQYCPNLSWINIDSFKLNQMLQVLNSNHCKNIHQTRRTDNTQILILRM